MGYAVFGAKSVQQLQKHIRTTAQRSHLIVILPHAKARMRTRKVMAHEVFEVLRHGVINRPPEPNPAKGSLECRVERYLAGRECAVVVALDDERPSLLVVTVMLC